MKLTIPYWKNKWIEFKIAKKYRWHTGIATLCITKLYYDKDLCAEDERLTNWWRFIPILGFRKKVKK